MIQLTKAEARHYPEFTFGSEALEQVHKSRKGLNGYYTEDFTYIVNHGSHKTLNTIAYGQRSVHMEDLGIVDDLYPVDRINNRSESSKRYG